MIEDVWKLVAPQVKCFDYVFSLYLQRVPKHAEEEVWRCARPP